MRHKLAFFASMLLTCAFPHPAQAEEHPFQDELNLFDIDIRRVPTRRLKVLTNREEAWLYVPEWHDLHALADGGIKDSFTPAGVSVQETERIPDERTAPTPSGYKGKMVSQFFGSYRRYSPIVVRDKGDGQWRSLGLCHLSTTASPVLADPFDKDLIWIGCNDGPPGLHADYFAAACRRWFDSILLSLAMLEASCKPPRFYFVPFLFVQ